MSCHIVALDKRPRVRPVSIGETLCRALAKLVMRAVGEQAKTACGNLRLCAGLKAGIEGATHAVVQRRVEQVLDQRGETDCEAEEEGEEPEEEGAEVVVGLTNLTIETSGTDEDADEGLAEALEMEVEGDRGIEGEEGV